MVQDTPSRKLDQYIVRFPDGMRDQLKELAALNKRSLNAEIISRLSDVSKIIADYEAAERRLVEAELEKRELAQQVEDLRRQVEFFERQSPALPEGLRKQITAAAEANERTVPEEVVQRLWLSLRSPEQEALVQKDIALMRREMKLMQDFMREMFVLAGGDEERLESTDLFREAGEVDAERLELDKARGKPFRKKE
mgnify:CR=1 FL=1